MITNELHILYDYALDGTDVYRDVNIYDMQETICTFDNSPRNRYKGIYPENMDVFRNSFFRTDNCKIAAYTEMLNMR